MARITKVSQSRLPPITEPIEELILEARQGNYIAAQKIMCTLMEDMGRYTCAAFEAVMSFLPADMSAVERLIELHGIDPLPEDLAIAKGDSIIALTGVYMAGLGCHIRPEEKDGTITILHDKLTQILTWMLVDLGHRPGDIDTSAEYDAEDAPCTMVPGALRGLLDLDPSLEAAIVSHPLGVEIALALWTPVDADSKPLYMYRQRSSCPNSGCAIMDIMLKFVRGTKAKEPSLIVKRVLDDSPVDKATFVQRLFARGILFQMMAPAKQETRQYCSLLQDCRSMIEISQCLLLEHPGEFLKSIDELNPVHWYCRTLGTLARAKLEDDLADLFLERILELLHFVYSEWVLRTPHLFTIKLSHALGDYGILEAIAVTLGKKDISPAVVEKLNNLVDLVKGSLLYPTAGKCLRKQSSSTQTGRPKVLALGMSFRKIPRKHPLCDNMEHFSRNHPVQIDAKACSNCQSVAYCSILCQQEDWEARHRYECNISCRIYRDQIVEERRYRQKLRTHHLGLAIGFFSDSLRGKHGLAIADHASSSLPSVAVVDMRRYPFTCRAVPLETYVADTKLLVPKHLKKRFDDLVKPAFGEENNDEPTCFRMIHLIVRFGREEVFLMATLTTKDLPNFKGVRLLNSMASPRWLSQEEAPPIPVPQFTPFDLPSNVQYY